MVNVKKPELTTSKPSKREQSSETNNPIIETTPPTPNPTVTVSQNGKTNQSANQIVNQTQNEQSSPVTSKISNHTTSNINEQNNDSTKETTNQTILDLPKQVVGTITPLSDHLTDVVERNTVDSVIPEKQITGILGK